MLEEQTSASRRQARNSGRWSLIILLVVIGVYVIGFLATWPRALLVSDEALYVNQAALFAEGTTRWEVPDAITSEPRSILISDYPPGTSLVQAPLVAVGGWRWSTVVSVIALVATALVLRRWLEREGRSPWFALLLFVHPTVLVMGRIAMSDAPSMLLTTAALALFWRGLPPPAPVASSDHVPPARRWAWPAAGFLAGLSLLFREPNLLVVGPFVAGALLRRDRHALRLLFGVAAGASVRLGVAALVFDDPFHFRAPGKYEGLRTQFEALGLIVLALVVLVPGGLLAVAFYRGRRRAEVVATVVLVMGFFTVYGYSAAQSGTLDRVILTPRFVLPVLPLVVFAVAEAAPRLLARVRAGLRARSDALAERELGRAAVTLLAAAAVIISIGAHVVVDRKAVVDARVVSAIADNTPRRARLVVNTSSLTKYLGPVLGAQPWTDRDAVPAIGLPSLLIRKGPVYLVFLDRSDSRFRDEEARANEQYLIDAGFWCDLDPRFDQPMGDGLQLRIFEARLR